MQKIAADQIFTGFELRSNVVLIMEDDGRILDIVARDQAGEDIRQEAGILCPGFINGHCHLELSHMKDRIPSGTGLVDFLIEVIRLRNQPSFDPDLKLEMMRLAEAELKKEGVVAVVDIANTADSAAVKAESELFWHSCVELLGLRSGAEKAVDIQADVMQALKVGKQEAVFSPHAPYSVSPALFEAINNATRGQLISIHNQECAAEDELFKTGKSDFSRLYNFLGITEHPIAITGKSSLASWLPYFDQGQQIILVHNSHTSVEELEWAQQYAKARGITLALCICPGANMYIEGRIAPAKTFQQYDLPILLGTDSLASNSQLSISAEMNTLREQEPDIPVEVLLHWATASAAAVIGKTDQLGSFQPGKKPGILLLDSNTLEPVRLL